MKRFVAGVIALLLMPVCLARAQNLTANEIGAKIFDAHMAQKLFVNGLRFCNELDGTNFYFEPRNRVLNLAEYHRSLEDLAKAQVFNRETRRPWSVQDAEARWEAVRRQAVHDKETCELVASLPALEKQLEEMRKNAKDSQKRD